ncbi:2-oxoglutarate oxidoreductase [Candidatus Calescamantes bacterium]|nr:2-oxoglutarate oxidoreductase [Candidatus Calescamantes bacterium]
MKSLYRIPESLKNVPTHYCPGCGHGVIHRIIAEVIDELEIREKTIGIAPVGCAVLAYDYWNFDVTEAPHGRPPAVATGIKRVLPDRIVFTYQGDGDLAAIGTAEIIHAGLRGERITVIFVNNSLYGMTGGQMAPTTLVGEKTATTPLGRNPEREGYPWNVVEVLKLFPGVTYVARGAIAGPKNIRKVKNFIKKAFLNQMENKGLSLVEILSPCPVNLRLEPINAIKWVEENLARVFPLGEFKT